MMWFKTYVIISALASYANGQMNNVANLISAYHLDIISQEFIRLKYD